MNTPTTSEVRFPNMIHLPPTVADSADYLGCETLARKLEYCEKVIGQLNSLTGDKVNCWNEDAGMLIYQRNVEWTFERENQLKAYETVIKELFTKLKEESIFSHLISYYEKQIYCETHPKIYNIANHYSAFAKAILFISGSLSIVFAASFIALLTQYSEKQRGDNMFEYSNWKISIALGSIAASLIVFAYILNLMGVYLLKNATQANDAAENLLSLEGIVQEK